VSIDVLELAGTPREIGRAHGEARREDVRALAAIRLELVAKKAPHMDEAGLLALAARHREPLERFDAAGAEELDGIAEGAGLTWERILVLNAYTDFRDVAERWRPGDGDGDGDGDGVGERGDEGCTALYVPPGRSATGAPLVAQTWDMHPSAEPYVLALRVRADGAPPCVVFTVAGCVGMAGLGAHGVACVINNLRPDDGRVGVSWPTLVRRVLRERTVAAAAGLFDGVPAGSGHHYLVADAGGAAISVETTGRRSRTTWLGGAAPFVHTNHYLDGELATHQVALGRTTTHERFTCASALLAGHRGPVSLAHLYAVLGDHGGHPRSVCSHLASVEPDMSKTCGALVADLGARTLHATRGCAHGAVYTAIVP
jgi:isopenicillin-N N-acyltransferase-like protein